MTLSVRLLTLALLSLVAACDNLAAATDPLRTEAGGAAEGVTFTVNATRYRHGDTIHVRLLNGGSASVGYNLCSAARERQTGAGWDVIEPMRMCTAALYLLKPGETASSSDPVDREWGSGRYRVATTIYIGESHSPRRLNTGTFQVSP